MVILCVKGVGLCHEVCLVDLADCARMHDANVISNNTNYILCCGILLTLSYKLASPVLPSRWKSLAAGESGR